MDTINQEINRVKFWISNWATFIIVWIRQTVLPTPALIDQLTVDSIRSATAQEKFNELLDAEEYEEALKTARKHSLDTDPVYKKKWSKSLITTDSIRLLLTPIKDTQWVIEQCLNCTSSDIEANRELLQFGQTLTEELLESYDEPKERSDSSENKESTIDEGEIDTFSDGEDEITQEDSNDSSHESLTADGLDWQDLSKIDFTTIDNQLQLKTLLINRYLFVKYLVRLKSYEKILSSNSRDTSCINQDYWKHFRSVSCFEILIDLAHKSEWRSVKVILSRHGPDTKEHLLTILSNFPETTKPSLYQDLLPSIDATNGAVVYPSFKNPFKQSKRESDVYDEIEWCYQLRDKLNLEDQANKFIIDFYQRNPFFTDFRRLTLDSIGVSSWFLVRAREIENRCGLVSNAIELLELGIDRNIPDLSSFKDDLDTYATLLYQCFPMYNRDDIGFSEFERLSKEERVNLLMEGAADDESRFIDCLNRFLLPYLHKISKNRTEEKELLWNFICDSAKHKLTIVQKIFIDYKMSKELGSVSGREIVQSDEDLIDYGIKCIYANERTDQLDAAMNIVETFPEDESLFFQMDQDRNAKVNRLYKRLEVAEILEQYNHFITVQRLEEMVSAKDKAGIKGILNKITREFCRRVDSASIKDQDWLQLLKDLEGMRLACFSEFLPQQDVHEVFIKGILTSGRLEHFKLASNFMQLDPHTPKKKLMSYEKSVETILEAAQHYVNSAASVNDEVIKTAKKCLALLGEGTVTSHPGNQKEKDFIEALSILGSDFDLTILPIQIRLMEDSKIELIQQVISSEPKAYKKTNQLLRLSNLLNIFGSPEEESTKSSSLTPTKTTTDETNEVRLLTILGNVAYERDDFNHCLSLCKLIMDKRYSTGWRLCELLGNCSSFKDYNSRLKLLSFVVIHCDDNLIGDILSSIRKLKLLLMEDELNCLQLTTESQQESTSSSLLSSLPTVEITSKLIKSMTRLAADQKVDGQFINQPDESEETIKKPSPNYNSINISPFYYDAFDKNCHFQFNLNNYDYNYLGFGATYSSSQLKLVNQQFQLRIEMLRKEIDWTNVDNLCKQLATTLLPLDTQLTLSTILPLKGANDELPFKNISPKSPALIFTALYFYSLLLYLKHLTITKTSTTTHNQKDDHQESISPAGQPMSAIISKSDQICKQLTDTAILPTADYQQSTLIKEKQLIESYFEMYCNIIQSDTIASLDPSVDVDRFASESDYRSDTLLGLAMTTDDKIFNIVISLGKQYSLSLIDLYLTHFEFLLTDPANDIEMIANRIFKNDHFVTILTDHKDLLEDYAEKRILPLIHPDDHNRLVLYYQIIEKICYPPSSPTSDDNDN